MCLLWSTTAAALSRDGFIRDFRHTVWGAKEGAPGGISTLAQTSDGYLWMGSASGLFRFDGVRFERIELPRDAHGSPVSIMYLFAPNDGGLWVGFTLGGAAHLKGGRWEIHGEREGLPPGSVKALAQEPDGTVWAGTTSGLARLEGKSWRRIGPDRGLPAINPETLLFDSMGTLWVTARNEVYFLAKGALLFQKLGSSFVGRFMSIAESPSGEIWLSSEGQSVRRIRQNGTSPTAARSVHSMIAFDRDGALWMVGMGGVRRIPYPERESGKEIRSEDIADSFSANEGLTLPFSNANILEDREGNVWLASASALERLSERRLKRFLPSSLIDPLRLASSDLGLTEGERNTVWLTSKGSSQLSTFEHGRIVQHPEVEHTTCSLRAADGSVWFGGQGELWRFTSGRFVRTALPEGAGNFKVHALAEDAAGGLWVSVVRNGVFRLAGGTWVPFGNLPSLPKLTALTLSSDARGRVWFGYTDGRVAVADGEAVRVFSSQEGLAVGNVTAFQGHRSRLWVGGDQGLAVLDDSRFRTLAPATEHAFDSLNAIIETATGDLWLSGSAGIVHVTAAEVKSGLADPAHRVVVEVFGALDGLEGTGVRLRPKPSAIETSDGKLWFSTSVGVYTIDPARIVRNSTVPPVLVKSVNVGSTAYRPEAGLTLPERTTALRIDYVGLSLTQAEKVRYRYKLEGVDKDWQDAQARHQAFYTNLGPGAYRFRVVASNNDGVWNEAGATLDFKITPAFVQTGWFIAFCVIAAVGASGLLIRMRVRQVSARLRGRLEERHAERERIARELHDTLLQSTQGLVLLFKTVANGDLADPEGAGRRLLKTSLARADEVMAEGRDRVLNLRVPAETGAALPQALAAAGDELARGAEGSLRTTVEGRERELDSHVRQEAYRIGREALVNAFQHARAASIEVQITYGDKEFLVHIRDDGVGIDTATLAAGSRPGHWGLKGMTERARQMGGVLDIWSRTGGGTEVALKIPGAVAYRRPTTCWPWRPKRKLSVPGA